jgi:PEP-CTERM motif
MKKVFVLASLAFSIAATPAFAARVPKVDAPADCAITDISPTALACTGFFEGNLLSGSGADITAQTAGLSPLGLAWDGVFANVTKINSLNGNTTVDFSTADQNPIAKIYGDTWIGVHFGAGAGLGGAVTGFYKLNAGVAGLQTILLNITQGSSGFVMYKTGTAPPPPSPTVPEPASWAMMIAGFGLVGAAMRRRKAAIA